MTDQPITLDDLDPENPKVFGRIADGEIAEYPVYDYHIVNRGHSFDQYTPVTYKKKHPVPPYHSVHEIPSISADGESIVVGYSEPTPFSLDALFSAIPNNHKPYSMPGLPELPGTQEDTTPLIVSDELRALIYLGLKERTQQRLDQFALTRDYSTILSAVSYENSTTPKRHAEAVRAKQLRDETWDALYRLQEDIIAGHKSFPHNWYEVEKQLPVLHWPDEQSEVVA
ncbi:MAG: hypothetical protein ACR2HF_09070 [Methylococcaceae bacterium]